jgi:hypothetical protein
MMRVRWQTAISKLDTPAIEEFAACRNRDEHRCIRVLDNADRRRVLGSSSHVLVLRELPRRILRVFEYADTLNA